MTPDEPAAEQSVVDAQAATTGTAPAPAEAAPQDAPTPGAEEAQVNEMLNWVRVPSWLTAALEKAKEEREYLHTEAFAEDDPNRVTCNDLLRSIWAKLALVWPQQPEATCKPPPQIDPPQEILDLAQQEERQNDLLMQTMQAAAPVAAEVGQQMPQMPPSPISDAVKAWKQQRSQQQQVARTASGLLNKMSKFAHLEGILQRAALDTLAVSLVYIKVGWSEDAEKDYLGGRRVRVDAQDQLAKLRQMETDYRAGRFTRDDAKWNEMLELRAYAVRYATEQIEKHFSRDQRAWEIATLPAGSPVPTHLLPEPERFVTGTADIVDLENIRLDWQRVTSPETMHLGRRIAERVWMSRDEVKRVFELSDEEADAIGRSARGTQKAPPTAAGTQSDVPNPAEDDLESEERLGADGDIAVWELWDREQHRIYWFCRGINRFLRTEIPEITRREFFPYIPLFFNPVSGRFMPISETTLGRKLQDDLNQALTDDREARIAQYPWYAVGQGLIDKEDIRAIEGRKPNKVVVTTKPAPEIKNQIVKMDGEDYRPELYQTGIAQNRMNMERMLGVPSEALQGQSKAKFATQVQVASDNMLAQSGRNGSAISEVMRLIFEAWLEFAAVAMPLEQVKAWLGQWAQWIEPDRSQIASGLVVEVVSAGNRGQRRQDLEDLGNAVVALNGVADAGQKFATLGWELQMPEIVKRIETALDLRMPTGLLQRLAMPLPPPPMPQQGGPGAGGPGKPQGGQDAPRQGLPTQEATTGGSVPTPGGAPPASS